MADHIDVFISSTSRDLGIYRARLRELILSMGMYPIGMESFNPTDRNAVQKCYDELQAAEIFVGVYAHRYGYCPGPESTYSGGAPDGQTSITHMEYLWALERKLPLLLFVVEDTQPWPPPDIEGEPGKTHLEQFKALIMGKHVVKFFSTPDDLAVRVSTALHETVERLGLQLQPEGWRVLQAPPPPPYFAGRSGDIAAIRELLKAPGARVVIQGAGGMGKTALAKHLGQALALEYPAGVLWTFLGPQAASVELTCAAAWADWKQVLPGGRAAEMKDVNAAAMKRWLSEAPGPLLVILDDIWHDEPLRALLDSLPDAAVVLSTARDAAHIKSKAGKRYALKHLAPADALLMLQRRLGVNGEHAADLNEIARLLGCHALALDLAAAYLENNSVHDTAKLIRRLKRHLGGENPFADLNMGSDRDDNLEAALSLSYAPLSDDLKRAFRLLGAIPSGLDFGAPMAFTVWGVNTDDEEAIEKAEDQLDTLARAALVERAETGRYLLHGNLNAYAVALMKRQPEEELSSAQKRYNADLLRIAGQFTDLPPEQWDTRIGPDYPHLHQRGNTLVDETDTWLNAQSAPPLEALTEPAPSAGLSPEQAGTGRSLLQAGLDFAYSGITKYVYLRSVGAEGRRWLRLGLLGARVLGESSHEPFFLVEIGLVYADLGEKRQALDYCAQALPLYRAVGDRGGEATTLNNLGGVYADLGEKRQALDYCAQALPLYRAVGDRGGEAATLNNLGGVYADLGEQRQALDYYAQALPLHRAVGDRGGEATTLNNLGLVYADLGEQRQALDYYAQALPLHRAVGDRGGEAATLNNLGLVYKTLEEKHKALDYYAQALPLHRAVGDRGGEATTLNNLGLVYDDLGEKHKALDYYEQALPLIRAVGDRGGEATTLNNLGLVYDDLGEKHKALDYYEQALPLIRAVGDRGGEATTLNNLGGVYADLGEKRKALDYYAQALPLIRAVGDRGGEAVTCFNIGMIYRAEGDLDKAIEYVARCVELDAQVEHPDLENDRATLENLKRLRDGDGEAPQDVPPTTSG